MTIASCGITMRFSMSFTLTIASRPSSQVLSSFSPYSPPLYLPLSLFILSFSSFSTSSSSQISSFHLHTLSLLLFFVSFVFILLLCSSPPPSPPPHRLGHDHEGGYKRDDHGVHHRTFESPLQAPVGDDCFATVDIYDDKIVVRGKGVISSSTYDL